MNLLAFTANICMNASMDIDNDIDQMLLQQFSCMNTTDRDVLISQFQKLLGNQINAATCTFFLDMNNWNLQEAVCAYFDLEAPGGHLPLMTLVRDVTIGEGEAIPPNTHFIKTWRVHNAGEESWPPGCCLKFTHGDRMTAQDQMILEVLSPHEAMDISVEMVSPEKPGIYQGQWRMCTAAGFYFGEIIWVIITVQEGGLLGVTQQLSQLSHFGTPPRMLQADTNPFASPTARFGGFPSSNGLSTATEGIASDPFTETCSELHPSSNTCFQGPLRPRSTSPERDDFNMMS